MKLRALIGFTFCDAMLWLADEARERGCAVAISWTDKRAWIGPDLFLFASDEASAKDAATRANLAVDEIITRESLESAA